MCPLSNSISGVQLTDDLNTDLIFHELRVFCVKFSCDASYVISGSDDTNLRLWKAKASEQMGVVRHSSSFTIVSFEACCLPYGIESFSYFYAFETPWKNLEWLYDGLVLSILFVLIDWILVV